MPIPHAAPAPWVLAAVLLATAALSPAAGNSPPLDWLRPWVALDRGDLRDLERGDVVARTLPAESNEIAVLFASAIDVAPDAFVDAVNHPERIWKSEKVPHVARFSNPPRLEDVASLTLGEDDVEAIRRCRPGDCDVKLSAGEIRQLQSAPSVQDGFRRAMVERAAGYLRQGLRAAGPYHDHETPVDPLTVGSGLLLRSPWLTTRAPRVAEHLEDYPSSPAPAGTHGFLYWLQTDHTPKTTVQILHVVVDRRTGAGPGPEVVVASRQIYASHYVNGSLATSALLQAGGRRYLVYLTRSHVDGLAGWFSGLRRLLVERGARGRGAPVFDAQRRAIERWTPVRPAAGAGVVKRARLESS